MCVYVITHAKKWLCENLTDLALILSWNTNILGTYFTDVHIHHRVAENVSTVTRFNAFVLNNRGTTT